MVSAVMKSEGRGKKRARKDNVRNASVGRPRKKRPAETRSKALVGRYVRKEFKGSGTFLGKIVSYDTGLYRVDYEDGDCEDLETGEVRELLLEEEDFDDNLVLRKKKLDELLPSRDANTKELLDGSVDDSASSMERMEASSLNVLNTADANEVDGIKVDEDADSSSDSCEYGQDRDSSMEVEAPLLPPPPLLPPSSGNICVPEECVAHLLSVYSFLRSFSVRLFLSPFTLDDFVGSLICLVPNTLSDAIHVALMRALRNHLEMLSSDGSKLASKCLRCIDWSLLDTLTWPVYLIQYLMLNGYTEKSEWKVFYMDVLERDYYSLPVGKRLIILQILCDDVLDSAELRAEIDMREEAEETDLDAYTDIGSEIGPKRVHPRYSKTSACKDQGSMEIISESHEAKSFGRSNTDCSGTEPIAVAEIGQDGNGDECRLCGMDGTLLCCDGCPSAYHSRCIGVSKLSIPEGAWYCPECTISKIGPPITQGRTSLRGAEVFGIDVYQQVFMGSCNHLLVLKSSINSEPCLRYYNQIDTVNVLRLLHSSAELIASYSEICRGILEYWKFPEDVLSYFKSVHDTTSVEKKEDDKSFTPLLAPLGKEGQNPVDRAEDVDSANCLTECSAENRAITNLENGSRQPGFTKTSLNMTTQLDHPGERNTDATRIQFSTLTNAKFSVETKVDRNISAASVGLQGCQSDLTHQSLADKSVAVEFASCTSTSSNTTHGRNMNGMCVTPNLSSKIKEGKVQVTRKGYVNIGGDRVYMGSFFKPHSYINYYVHGDFAASAAANLAILSSEETRVSESHSLNNQRKVLSANISLQVKAFSSAAIRFFWPNTEKKLVEVPRERCGWCLSCKSHVTSKKGCLLNSAASNAVKGATKVLTRLRSIKNGGTLSGIAMYVMFTEESLFGLAVGPFLNANYRRQWRKQLEQASTCSALKTLLLELEKNIRIIALSGDWVKLVDYWAAEPPVTQNASASGTGSTQKRGLSGRRGRKPSALTNVTADDNHDSRNFVWWRGGMLSKLIFQKGTLPCLLVKKAARQGGSRKIPDIHYVENTEVPKRSRQLIWRTAVEMSKNVSQLALQVRYLDLHVRWGDLIRPEQSLLEGKGPETEASAFRNAFICDKKIVENTIRYGVDFRNQKHLPSRVMKNIIEVEKIQDGKETHWFSETRIPLYLIKEYEENMAKVLLPSVVDKPTTAFSKLQKRQLKASRKDIFSYLCSKRDNKQTCHCASCEQGVLLGNAVKCNVCQGFCHEDCTICSTAHLNAEIEFLITCKQCYRKKIISQNKNSNESATNPRLLLGGQETRNATPIITKVVVDSRQKPLKPVGVLETSSSKIKLASDDTSLTKKTRRKICSWGLIWKKNNDADTGINFRLKYLLLKGNHNRIWPEDSEPVCRLCQKPYNHDLMYVRCPQCDYWYHAAAVELEESSIFSLVGFKCCRCRRIKSPECPFADKKPLESKKPRIRAPSKKGNLGSELDVGMTTSEQSNEVEEPTTRIHTVKEEVNDPLGIEQFSKPSSDSEFEWNNAGAYGPTPQKLQVRRQIKHENEVDCNPPQAQIDLSFEANNPPGTQGGLLSPPQQEVEWDVSNANGFDDGLMFDYDSLGFDDMEFEPQTYFSFTELLETDDGIQLDGGGVDTTTGDDDALEVGNWGTCLPVVSEEQYIITGNGPNHPSSSTPCAAAGTSGGGDHTVIIPQPCWKCHYTEPCPDLCCEICGLWVHSHCSPWVEESPSALNGGGSWRCGNCREWR